MARGEEHGGSAAAHPRAAIPESPENLMKLPAVAPAAVLPTLAQQEADFTAEGSPPPGKVPTQAPVTADPSEPGVKRVHGTLALKRPPAARHH